MEGHYVSVHLGGYYRGQVYPQTPSHVIVFVARGDRKTVTHCERSAQQSRHASFGSGPHPFKCRNNSTVYPNSVTVRRPPRLSA
jgi:hypothetical protein